MEPIEAGLIRGRHELPAEKYIFEEIENPLDFSAIYMRAESFVMNECNVREVYGRAVNSASYTDDCIYEGEFALVLYVTGLSSALAAVVKACAKNGVSLTLMHFDRESGDYRPQRIF